MLEPWLTSGGRMQLAVVLQPWLMVQRCRGQRHRRRRRRRRRRRHRRRRVVVVVSLWLSLSCGVVVVVVGGCCRLGVHRHFQIRRLLSLIFGLPVLSSIVVCGRMLSPAG